MRWSRIAFPVRSKIRSRCPYLRCSEPWNYDIALSGRVEYGAHAGSRRFGRDRIAFEFQIHVLEYGAATPRASANGTAVRPGDLYASGTISGFDPGSYGSFIELTWRGARPLQLRSGETRAFLEYGDSVTLRGYCEAPGKPRIGFGGVAGNDRAR